MRNDFIFRGQKLSSFGGYICEPVAIPRAKLAYEEKQIMGSSKLLYLPLGDGDELPALEPVNLSVSCVLRDGNRVEALANWLRGYGELVLSSDEAHSLRAFVANQIDLEKVIRARADRRFDVQFRCEGWRYRYPAPATITLSAPGNVTNPGTAASEPLVEVSGSGNVNLMIGGRTLLIDGLSGTMLIDCEARLAWVGDVLSSSMITRVGGWPILTPGSNAVSWSGGVTKVEITPRWRDY